MGNAELLGFVYLYFNASSYRLEVYRYLAPLRLLVCGGDGSVGWVLKEIDKLQLKVSKLRFVALLSAKEIGHFLG